MRTDNRQQSNISFYTEWEGYNCGVFCTQEKANKQVKGYSGFKLKKFSSREGALRQLCYGDERHKNVFVAAICYSSSTSDARFGVYYGPGDRRNVRIAVSKVEPDAQPTNLRTDFHALIYALETVRKDLSSSRASRRVRIISSSVYVVKSFNKRWSKGQKYYPGRKAANIDLIQKMVSLKDTINNMYQVRGWDEIQVRYGGGRKSGNEASKEAYRLAKFGANKDHTGEHSDDDSDDHPNDDADANANDDADGDSDNNPNDDADDAYGEVENDSTYYDDSDGYYDSELDD